MKIILPLIIAASTLGCIHPYSIIKPWSYKKPTTTTSTEVGRKILATGQKMVSKSEILKGGCWDYVDVMYHRAGYPQNQRKVVFKSSKDSGPYADPKQLQAGDWLYHVNHGYHGVGHSGVFVRWIDKSKHMAEMLSYAGENRGEPGRYKKYDLSSVYSITRAQE